MNEPYRIPVLGREGCTECRQEFVQPSKLRRLARIRQLDGLGQPKELVHASQEKDALEGQGRRARTGRVFVEDAKGPNGLRGFLLRVGLQSTEKLNAGQRKQRALPSFEAYAPRRRRLRRKQGSGK